MTLPVSMRECAEDPLSSRLNSDKSERIVKSKENLLFPMLESGGLGLLRQ